MRMQIDLLVSQEGELGILCDTEFESQPSGVIFDGVEYSLTLEFSQTYDSLVMNVPLSDELATMVSQVNFIHLGILNKGRVAQAYQLPLMHVNVQEEAYY